jgi:MFS transporter, FLVCR family, feline leukemia virus subgroup C receptor-related protein
MQSAPPTPPSYAQANRNQQDESISEYLKSLLKLLKNVNFVLILIAYSINLAVFSAITTFLNQMIIPLYPVS